MLCPNCGTRSTTNEHKFCRNCGMNLEPVARALAAHLSLGGRASAAAARDTERRNVTRMTNGLVAGLVVVLFGVLLMAFVPGKAFTLLGVASALLGIVAALAAVFSTLRRAAGDGGVEPAPMHALEGPAAETSRLLHESSFEPLPTVTERTTDLLNVEAGQRKPQE